MSRERIRTVLVGCGNWGRNLLREITRHPEAELVAVVDPAPAAQARALSLAPEVALVSHLSEALRLDIDAVVIASPPAWHAEHALEALHAGAHVFVEKPLTTDVLSAEDLLRHSRRSGRIAMVGHLMRYHPAISRLLTLAREGAIGRIRRGFSTRRSSRPNEGCIVWALAPHDLSLWRAMTSTPILRADVTRLGDNEASLRVESETQLVCHVELSRAHATRERRFTLVGETGLLVFDDGGSRPTLHLLEKAFDADDAAGLDAFLAENRHALIDVSFEAAQPLAVELDHFFTCIRTGQLPRTGFDEGTEVVRVLHRALVT